MNDVAIFGAGNKGRLLLSKNNRIKVRYFIDNDKDKIGKIIDGVRVISLSDYLVLKNKPKIIIPTTNYLNEAANQLEDMGILDWDYINADSDPAYSEESIIYSPYKDDVTSYCESEYNKRICNDDNIIKGEMVYARRLYRDMPLFNHVEIETINRCNGACMFCPVSFGKDVRTKKIMEEHVFVKIIEELSEIKYDGRLSLFSNNEPFLDDRIIDFQKYAKNKLPYARHQLLTNGTLLTLDKFTAIIDYVDDFVIDNYNQNLELIPQSKVINEYCKDDEALKKKVTIVLRKPNEVLTSRGGLAPNRKEILSFETASCCLPFRQLIIRPDGKISLCCNDPLGQETLGDVNNDTLQDIWYGDKFDLVRKRLLEGRKYIEKCRFCDTFYYF